MANNHFAINQIACFLFVISCCLPFQPLVDAKLGGFTIEIIHRDSQLSPFRNHSATVEDLSNGDALRSIARANHFHQSSSDTNKIQSTVTPTGGDYLMKLSIGSPPVEVLAVADTGKCYPQDAPLFDPNNSSTYVDLSCDSTFCEDLPSTSRHCSSWDNKCQYEHRYGDQSYTRGALATDTFTFVSTDGAAPFPNSVFGCGHNNGGTFDSRGSGVVGLGGGPLSLISQLGSQIEQKFSYCLLPRTMTSASKLKFGSDAILTGPEVVSTPFSSDSSGTFYYLTLESVSVEDKKITNNQLAAAADGGNIIIDSGTTLTLLESSFYDELETAVKEKIQLAPVDDPRGSYSLCYDRSSFENIPEVTLVFHFRGADVELKKLNLFRAISSDLSCFTMVPTNGGKSIYGNWAQINFQVEYDLAGKQVSFAPADCSQLGFKQSKTMILQCFPDAY
ncbi:Nepenthesin [Bertholletia excelsa]